MSFKSHTNQIIVRIDILYPIVESRGPFSPLFAATCKLDVNLVKGVDFENQSTKYSHFSFISIEA
jgi:hypothetical protein